MALQKFDLDTTHSSIAFVGRHLMVSKVHGRFASWSGSFEFDEENPTASKVEVTIDAASLDTKFAQRDDHLRSPDFLDVQNYPHITFKSTQVERLSPTELKLTGELTIHGVTRPVTLDVEYAGRVKDPWGGERVGFSARTAIQRKDFGLTWNVALEAGGVVVSDKIEILIEIEAVRAQAAQGVKAA